MVKARATMFTGARAVAGLSVEDAAKRCGISFDSYRTREATPGEFRLKELIALHESISPDAQKILMLAIDSLFLSE